MGDCIGTHPWDEICPRCDTGDSKDFQASTKHDPTPTPEQPTASAKPYPRWWPHDAADALRSYRSRNTVNGKTFGEILDAALDNAYEAGRAAVSAPEQDEAVRLAAAEVLDLIYHGPQPSLGWLKRRAEVAHLQDAVRRAVPAAAGPDQESMDIDQLQQDGAQE